MACMPTARGAVRFPRPFRGCNAAVIPVKLLGGFFAIDSAWTEQGMTATGNWAYEADVVVVGSGAGALTAAVRARDLGLEVLVIEKTGQYGGSSAMSGGVLWLPNSPLVAGAGGSDSAEEGKRYMKSVIGEPHLEPRIDAYV